MTSPLRIRVAKRILFTLQAESCPLVRFIAVVDRRLLRKPRMLRRYLRLAGV